MPRVDEWFSTGAGCDWRMAPTAELMSLTILVVVPVTAAGRVSLNKSPVKAEACT